MLKNIIFGQRVLEPQKFDSPMGTVVSPSYLGLCQESNGYAVYIYNEAYCYMLKWCQDSERDDVIKWAVLKAETIKAKGFDFDAYRKWLAQADA